jgi:UPF0176 protein
MSEKNIVNIAAYKFVRLAPEGLEALKADLLSFFENRGVLGTILLAKEGINLGMSGTREAIDAAKDFLTSFSEFSDLWFKETLSEKHNYAKIKVKIKAEIVALGEPDLDIHAFPATHLSPEALKQWIESGKDFVLLDTRNDYEYDIGTFEGAVQVCDGKGIDKFRQFKDAVNTLPIEMKDKPIVTFCTGGIRCEKAAPFMVSQGFKEVYQLDGGILNYFQTVGSEHFKGDCFIFDDRTSVTTSCEETGLAQCEVCQAFVSPLEQRKTNYKRGGPCIHCLPTYLEKRSPSHVNH